MKALVENLSDILRINNSIKKSGRFINSISKSSTGISWIVDFSQKDTGFDLDRFIENNHLITLPLEKEQSIAKKEAEEESTNNEKKVDANGVEINSPADNTAKVNKWKTTGTNWSKDKKTYRVGITNGKSKGTIAISDNKVQIRIEEESDIITNENTLLENKEEIYKDISLYIRNHFLVDKYHHNI